MPKIIKNGISYGVPANLSDLYDTNITTPANGDIIQYNATAVKWENVALSGAFLPTTGGTMTGQIKTSFNQSVAMGSYQASATTIPDLCTELRYSSGCCGSFSLSTAYTLSGVTINTGWYNFLWIPHRSGGINGEASGDNCNYGACYISGMTVNGAYLLRFSSGSPTYLCDLNSGETDYGTTGTTTKIKIKITSTASWMLCFTVTLYQGYRATKVMISGYNYGASHWYDPKAKLIGDSNGTETLTVYFGYDSDWNLWVGFDGGNYTGVHIDDVTNGYTQVCKTGLFNITNVSSLGGTTQSTVTAESKANNSNKLNGYASDTAATNSTIARRTDSGYLFAKYFNQSSADESSLASTGSYGIYANSDGYLRKATMDKMKSALACSLAYLGYTSGTTAKNFSYTTSFYNEIVLAARFSNKIVSGCVPTNLLSSSNQEVWLTGGRGNSLGAMNSDSVRAVLYIKQSGTTSTTTQITIQGVATNNEGTVTTSSTTWYVYVR